MALKDIHRFAPALAAALLFGLSAPLSKLLLKDISSILLASLLYLGSGTGLLFFRALTKATRPSRKESAIGKNDLPWLAGSILAGGVAAPIALFSGLASTPASVASLLMNFEGVATAFIAAFVFREACGRKIWAAIFLILIGSAILSFEPDEWAISIAAMFVLASCIFWGIDNNLTQRISLKDPVEIAMLKGIFAGTISLALALILGSGIPALPVVFSALLLGFFSYGLSTAYFVYSLRNLGTSRTSALFGIAPFIGAAASFLLLKEQPNVLFTAALPFMLAGVYFLFSERHEHTHTHKPMEHEHPHDKDEYHLHRHDKETMGHFHLHEHAPATHTHRHTPDAHHRHRH